GAGIEGGAGGGGAAGASGAVGADGGAGVGAGGASGAGQVVFTFSQGLNRSVDVVFMVDDSSSMTPLQAKLTDAFPAYIDALKALPGGLPDIHIGVVSSSMGAGRDPNIDHCPQGGDQGVFHTKPLGGPACLRASLNAGQSFISNVGGQVNYTGDITDVFACIALLGAQGCGFEHQLASVARALGADGAPAPAQNANFLRADALLQVILLTNEDDCSAPPDSALFDETSMTIEDPLGPLQSYRCNEFGHLCGGQKPPRSPGGEVDLGTCVSNEMGMLIPVGGVVTALKALKADPGRVLVSAITGPPTPYKVNVGPSDVKGDPDMWPYVEHSCLNTEADGSQTYADPAVRLKQWVDGFGAHGLFQSLCAADFAGVLTSIAAQVGSAFGPACLPATVDPSKCSSVDNPPGATGASTPLRACASNADAGPCWYAKTDATACPSGHEVVFNRPAAEPAGASTTVTCQTN
ncbi:MAG TPA: hypothetical protein VHL80_02620, partial [Polyangia bacterium]|nr:hypothetical protein [Polyangia bacterium]